MKSKQKLQSQTTILILNKTNDYYVTQYYLLISKATNINLVLEETIKLLSFKDFFELFSKLFRRTIETTLFQQIMDYLNNNFDSLRVQFSFSLLLEFKEAIKDVLKTIDQVDISNFNNMVDFVHFVYTLFPNYTQIYFGDTLMEDLRPSNKAKIINSYIKLNIKKVKDMRNSYDKVKEDILFSENKSSLFKAGIEYLDGAILKHMMLITYFSDVKNTNALFFALKTLISNYHLKESKESDEEEDDDKNKNKNILNSFSKFSLIFKQRISGELEAKKDFSEKFKEMFFNISENKVYAYIEECLPDAIKPLEALIRSNDDQKVKLRVFNQGILNTFSLLIPTYEIYLNYYITMKEKYIGLYGSFWNLFFATMGYKGLMTDINSFIFQTFDLLSQNIYPLIKYKKSYSTEEEAILLKNMIFKFEGKLNYK